MKLKIFNYLGNLNWRAMKTSGDKKKKAHFGRSPKAIVQALLQVSH